VPHKPFSGDLQLSIENGKLTQKEAESESPREEQEGAIIIDEQGMYGFFRSYYAGASGEEETSSILRRPINEDESKFLVRLMDRQTQGFVTYEEFLDFILPRTKKRFSNAFVRKVSKKK
jgi:hypothetical protein